MKKFIALAAVALITNLPISCCTDSCCGETFELQESTITVLTAVAGSYSNPRFFASPSTDASTAAIKIEIVEVELTKKVSEAPEGSFSFISKALACDPPMPEPTQAIESISITASEPVYAMQQVFEPGDDLSGLFVVANRNYTTIEEFVRKQNADHRDFGWEGDAIVLQLAESPDSTVNQSLRLVFEFDDAATFEMESGVFRVDAL